MSPRAAVPAAAVLALTPAAHVLYLGWVPGRAGWWLLWAGLSAAAYGVLRLAARPVAARLRAGGRPALVLPAAAGLALAGWWHGTLLDCLWFQAGWVRTALLPVLELSHAAVAAAGAGTVVAALMATDPPREPARPHPPVPWAGVALLTLAGCLFAAWYVGSERTVYAADFMYYWDRAADWAGRLRADPAAGADEFRRSVQNDGYTLLPVLPHALAILVLGDHRLVFVLVTVVAYLPPLAVASVAFVRLAGGERAAVPALLALGVFPGTWLPVVLGFPDLGGVGLAVATLVLYLGRPAGRLRSGHLLGLAALLVVLPLFRRWYAFWLVAFGLLVAVDVGLAALAAARRGDRAEAVRRLRPAVALAVLVPLGLAAVALPGVRTMAGGDYADTHTGYQRAQPLAARLVAEAWDLGPVYPAAALLAVLPLAAGPGRRAALFAAGMGPVLVLHFLRVQDFDQQHLYLLLPACALVPAAAAARVHRAAWVPLAGGGLLLFAPLVSDDAAGWWRPPLASAADYRPARRADLPEFRRLAGFLDARPLDERFVVLSSSLDLHSSMVQAIGRSLRVPVPAAARQLRLQDIDRVDGFPTAVFQAGLVLVADPPQVHMRPGEQQVVLLPARLLLAGTGVGAAFDRRPEQFHLDGGVTLRVFERARPLSPGALDEFATALRAAHPDRPRVFAPPAGVDGSWPFNAWSR